MTKSPARSTRASAARGPDVPALDRLAAILRVHAPHDGYFELSVPGVSAIRRSRPTGEVTHAAQRPAVCVVAQGAKLAMLGREVYEYDAGQMLVFSVDLPIAGQLTRASRAEPFLCVKIDLDPYKVAELTLRVFPQGVPTPRSMRGLYVGESPEGLIDAAARLLGLMTEPGDAELLAPLVVDEILIRLLRSPVGSRVAQLGGADSGLQRIAKAVSWIRANFSQPIAVDALAKLVHMSLSSFHQHFKAVTAMSPLQYQKVLRLQEARRLMMSQTIDARTASRQVGYLSASQFSREYARLFGSAPTRDIANLREEGFPQARAGSWPPASGKR